MSALSVIRGGVIGLAAVALPAVALGVAEVFTLRGLGPFVGLFCVTLLLVGILALACVRVAHFAPALAVFLTTVGFDALPLMTVRTIGSENPAPFLLALAQLTLGVFVAWAGTRLAKR